MALPTNPIRYIVTLSVPGGWPDQSTELRPADMERELRSIFGANITCAGGSNNAESRRKMSHGTLSLRPMGL